MFKIRKVENLVPNIHMLEVEAPDIARQIQPGQFVIVRGGEGAERIPLSVADWNYEEGTLTMVFMEVGASTEQLAGLRSGQEIPTVVGPLGRATRIEKFGTVVCIGGCYGIGALYPAVRALKEKGNRVIMIAEARSRYLLYWEKKLAEHCDRYLSLTRDGSRGTRGHVADAPGILRELDIKPDRIIANGCTHLVYSTSRHFKSLGVPIIVALNSIMIDGTGMCGVCRLTVDGKMKFACVDGPEFEGNLVDWEELFKRRRQYLQEEAYLSHHSGCGGI
jgi:ferredoxin--NADP+ reductase